MFDRRRGLAAIVFHGETGDPFKMEGQPSENDFSVLIFHGPVHGFLIMGEEMK